MGSVPGLGRSPEEETGNPFQYFCLGNPMDRGAWQAIYGVTKELGTTETLNTNNNKPVFVLGSEEHLVNHCLSPHFCAFCPISPSSRFAN